MTSAGGHPRIRHELAAQLRAAERGAAAPWIEEPQHPATAPLASLAAAAATLSFLHPDSIADELHFPVLAATTALPLWLWWRAPATPSGPRPPEITEGPWRIFLALAGAMAGIVAVSQVLDPWLVALMAATTMWLLVTWHRHVQARAVARLQQRLRAAPLPTPTPREDEGEAALRDPLLDTPTRIGLMSVLVASHRAVPVDFLAEHLARDRGELTDLIDELAHMRYIDVATSRRGRSRCAPTYPGTSATRRHRQALRQQLAGLPT